MLPDEFKHSQDDHTSSITSDPSQGVNPPTPEPSRPFWERPETVSLEHGMWPHPHGPGSRFPGPPPLPPFPPFPAHFPFFGPHRHGPPPPPPPPPPGAPGEHPDPPLPPPPPRPVQGPLGSFGPLRDYLENIASWTQEAVNTYTGAGEHAHGHRNHGRHPLHFEFGGPHRGRRRGHHDEEGSDGEGSGHHGPGGPPRRGRWGPHRGRWGGRGPRGPRCHPHPHPEFIHPPMDIVSSDDAYTVTIELPGLKKDEVDIAVQERVLTVSGEFKPDTPAPAPPPAPTLDQEGYSLEDMEEETFIGVDDDCEKKKDGIILKERRVGKFKRSIDLPSWVDAEKGVKASMADGVLTIVFTKGPESKAKKVDIL